MLGSQVLFHQPITLAMLEGIIPREQLQHLINAYSIPRIAHEIGVSPWTVHGRMIEYGLYIRDTFSDITYCELDGFIADIHHEFQCVETDK